MVLKLGQALPILGTTNRRVFSKNARVRFAPIAVGTSAPSAAHLKVYLSRGQHKKKPSKGLRQRQSCCEEWKRKVFPLKEVIDLPIWPR